MLRGIASLLVIIIILLIIISKKLEELIKNSIRQWNTQRDIYYTNESILRFFDKEYDKACEEAFYRRKREENELIKYTREQEASKKKETKK